MLHTAVHLRGWRGPIQSAVSSPPVQADAIGSPTARPHRSFVLEASRNGCRRFHFTDGTDDFARESIREEKSNPSASATGRFASSRARNAPLPQRDRRPWFVRRRSTNPSHRGDTAHSRGIRIVGTGACVIAVPRGRYGLSSAIRSFFIRNPPSSTDMNIPQECPVVQRMRKRRWRFLYRKSPLRSVSHGGSSVHSNRSSNRIII